jgi:hypothetical protein
MFRVCVLGFVFFVAGTVGAAAYERSDLVATAGHYAQVRATLLHKGLRVAPDKAERPDREFPEIDCAQSPCRALFLNLVKGWQQYVVVEVDARSQAVTAVRDPFDAEGLVSIPPPPGPGVPHLEHSYLAARAQLQRLGFKATRPRHDVLGPARYCVDIGTCKRFTTLDELSCSGTGMGFCTAFWTAPNGRILTVTTIGEDHESVYYAEWSNRAALEDFRRW